MIELPADALVIGLGGNVGDVLATFVRAREALAQLGPVRSAPLYRTAPIGPEAGVDRSRVGVRADARVPAAEGPLAGPAQPPFLNSVVRIQCADATPGEVIATVLELERLLGRDRTREARWGPRTIDLDVLLWGAREIRTPELEVPHPRLTERRFVIEPLIALFGDDLVVAGRSLGEHGRAVAAQQVELIEPSW